MRRYAQRTPEGPAARLPFIASYANWPAIERFHVFFHADAWTTIGYHITSITTNLLEPPTISSIHPMPISIFPVLPTLLPTPLTVSPHIAIIWFLDYIDSFHHTYYEELPVTSISTLASNASSNYFICVSQGLLKAARYLKLLWDWSGSLFPWQVETRPSFLNAISPSHNPHYTQGSRTDLPINAPIIGTNDPSAGRRAPTEHSNLSPHPEEDPGKTVINTPLPSEFGQKLSILPVAPKMEQVKQWLRPSYSSILQANLPGDKQRRGTWTKASIV